jgi:release factor glutamine methyltransferase
VPVISQWSQTPDLQVLLAHVTGKNRAWVLAHPEAVLTPEQEQTFLALKARYEAGEPLPYLLGNWEFYGLDFYVSPDVLIPRPETELLIDSALAWARMRSATGAGLRFIDIGTGSGCIPVTLATRLPDAEISATDISPAALAVARLNAEKHGVAQRIAFHEADLFPGVAEPSTVHRLPSTFDLILSNPPYIPTETMLGLPIYGREPTLALDGGPDGMATIRRLLGRSKQRLAAGGTLLLEIEYRQGAQVAALARENFPDADIHIHKDLAGLDRLLAIDT